MSPAFKRYDEGGSIEEKWGTFVSDAGSMGGVIDLECDEVYFCIIMNDSASPGHPRIQLNVPVGGQVTITTVANATGRFKAMCNYN